MDLLVSREGQQGPTVLFIHGATLDHRMWRDQVEALGVDHDVITYDCRGCGKSPPPTVTFCHYQDAAAVLDDLGVGRAVVVGHSIGALYALELALAQPGRIAGLALVCMSGLGKPSFPAEVQAMFGAIRAAVAERGVAAGKELWAACGWFASAREQPKVAAQLDAMLADYSGWFWQNVSPAQNLVPPAVERLEELAMPVLVFDGGRDLDYNHAVADELASRIAGVRLLRVPHVGHMAPMEDPELINEALRELVQRAFPTDPSR